jgi:hypothetical protein
LNAGDCSPITHLTSNAASASGTEHLLHASAVNAISTNKIANAFFRTCYWTEADSRALRAALNARRTFSSVDSFSKAMTFLHLGHGILAPPRIFRACSLK